MLTEITQSQIIKSPSNQSIEYIFHQDINFSESIISFVVYLPLVLHLKWDWSVFCEIVNLSN